LSGKSYIDRQGRVYVVLRITAAEGDRPAYRAFREEYDGDSDISKWHPIKSLPYRDSQSDAQRDLDAFADATLEVYEE
jgi:hypothetical protein